MHFSRQRKILHQTCEYGVNSFLKLHYDSFVQGVPTQYEFPDIVWFFCKSPKNSGQNFWESVQKSHQNSNPSTSVHKIWTIIYCEFSIMNQMIHLIHNMMKVRLFMEVSIETSMDYYTGLLKILAWEICNMN